MQVFFLNLHNEVVALYDRPKDNRSEVVEAIAEMLLLMIVQIVDHFFGEVVFARSVKNILELLLI